MENYAILRINKYHTFHQIHEQQLHNNREIYMPHIDANKTIQNIQLIDPAGNYTDSWKRRIKSLEIEQNKKVNTRRNSVLAIEVMCTFSPDMTDQINIKDWAKENVKFLENKFGKENILACTLHMDETTPHIHATIIPIDKSGNLAAKNIINGPKDMKDLQTDYAKLMEPFGLKRGEKKTKAKNQSLVNFYDSINKVEKNPAPVKKDDESNEEYIERLYSYIKTMRLAYLNMKNKAKRTDDIINTRIANAFSAYKDAVFFYELLLKQFHGNKKLAQKRIEDYSKLEISIPQDKLDLVIRSLEERFPIEENIMNMKFDETK